MAFDPITLQHLKDALSGAFPNHAVILTRSHADSDLRRWGMKLREKIGFKRAAVAVARKLTVITHAMLRSGELFIKTTATARLKGSTAPMA